MRLIQGDCLIENEQIESGSVDLILTDLPYGTMRGAQLDGWKNQTTDWDNAICPIKVFEMANRILRKNGKIVLFSQEPYTSRLITQAIPNVPFSYRMMWEKDNFANALLCNKAPVGMFEDILVFSKSSTDNTDETRKYLREEKAISRLTSKQFNYLFSDYTDKHGCRDRSVLEHYWGKSQSVFPTKDIYENVLQKTGFFTKSYEDLIAINNKYLSTFNLWQGNKYKSNILKYKKDYNGFHPTQKPVLLLEDLVKTFSNEGNLVVDLTMGSGSTGVACKNTNREFIGIEKDEGYFKIAQDRIKVTQPSLFGGLQ